MLALFISLSCRYSFQLFTGYWWYCVDCFITFLWDKIAYSEVMVTLNWFHMIGVNSSLSDTQSSLSRGVANLTANSLEYSWVIQHHSLSSYPDCWSQPVKLLAEFCQTEDYKSRLAARLTASAVDDDPSHIRGGSVVDAVCSKLPSSMEMKCSAPHLHRWNPSVSSDFADYFHDRIKVLSTGAAVYRYCSHSCLTAVIYRVGQKSCTFFNTPYLWNRLR